MKVYINSYNPLHVIRKWYQCSRLSLVEFFCVHIGLIGIFPNPKLSEPAIYVFELLKWKAGSPPDFKKSLGVGWRAWLCPGRLAQGRPPMGTQWSNKISITPFCDICRGLYTAITAAFLCFRSKNKDLLEVPVMQQQCWVHATSNCIFISEICIQISNPGEYAGTKTMIFIVKCFEKKNVQFSEGNVQRGGGCGVLCHSGIVSKL